MPRLSTAFLFVLISVTTFCAEKEADAASGIKGLKLAKDFKASLWTTDKQVQNPTAISFDDQNRLYVAETFRFRLGGGLDIREAGFMFYDDMQLQTPEERRAMYIKHKERFKPDYFTKNKEKIVLLEDTQHTGKADKTTLFAEAFNDALDGPAVGVAWHEGKLYYACVPNIWVLEGAKGSDAKATKMDVLFDGMGVRVGISGHDVHATVIGPDGRLYWSIGDRGYNVTSKEGRHFINPCSGAVFRSNLDGTNLELYYTGLRNPQELAFDEWGNLFTGDNNANTGDDSRLEYILEGGTSGWHSGWQLLAYADFATLGGLDERKPDAWNHEGMWKLRTPAQPSDILPPVGLITNGPCGLAYYPGTGLPESYSNHFFICDYTAGANSGVYSCLAEESGAGFNLKDKDKFAWGIPATDVAFGYNGKVYISDYGGGWGLPMKGAIYAIAHAESLKNPIVEEVRALFNNESFSKMDAAGLSKLLAHVDMRVRQRAQFELAKRGKEGFAALTEAARSAKDLHARVHGIWGMGQLSVTEPDALNTVVWLLHDDNARVREQAAKTLGDVRYAASIDALLPLLNDPSPRVKTFVAIALGKMKCNSDVTALLKILRDNDDKDAFLRHGAVMGLVGANDVSALRANAKDASRAVRLGILLALRRLDDPAAAMFLNDSDPFIYADAVRAIYDTPITAAMPELAAQAERILADSAAFKKTAPLIVNRILHASARYTGPGRATVIARLCAETTIPENIRVMGLKALQRWENPTLVDPVLGLPRPHADGPRTKLVPDDAMREALKKIIDEPGAISAKAAELALALNIELKDELLLSFINDTKRSEGLRVISLRQLGLRNSPALAALLPQLSAAANVNVRAAALEVQLRIDPAAGLKAARTILEGNGPPENKLQVLTDRTNGAFSALATGGPTNEDYADQNSKHGVVFSFVPAFGKPIDKAGTVGETLPRLNDGAVAQNDDDIERNSWIDGSPSRIVCDLKKDIEIAAVETFSWHVKNRAPQHFTLWGSSKDKPDVAAKNLKKDWVNIASINTESLGEGGKHGSLIYNAGGSIGRYRYLLWQSTRAGVGTFFSEMDVHEKGKWSFNAPANRAMQQKVFQVLASSNAPGADTIIGEWMTQLLNGKAPRELQLDIFEATQARKEDALQKQVAEFQKSYKEDDKLAPFRSALFGGDAKTGHEIFQFHAASCIRCHKVSDGHEGGGEAGPKLAGVGTRLTREKILESIIDPSAVIVPGYGSSIFKLNDNSVITASIVEETETELTLKDADGKTSKLAKSEIKKRSQPISPMPPMGEILKPRELRDLIEFLSSLK